LHIYSLIKNKMTMKKIMFVFASVLVLTACGTGNNEATATTESATVTVDTTLATTDSTAVPTGAPTEVTTDKAIVEEVK
jgi:uncharacterized lipoprotein YajG